MSPMQSQFEGEIIPPVNQGSPAEAYSPEQARRHREYSVWDPRSAPGTYFLLAVNIAVYLWMITHGVDPRDPSERALIHYGANHTWLVLHGQWYRLLTATFVHVGLLHLASNMWCLWNLGILGEPLIGPLGMVAVYMLTGIAGNLLSMAWNVGYAIIARDPRSLFQVGCRSLRRRLRYCRPPHRPLVEPSTPLPLGTICSDSAPASSSSPPSISSSASAPWSSTSASASTTPPTSEASSPGWPSAYPSSPA